MPGSDLILGHLPPFPCLSTSHSACPSVYLARCPLPLSSLPVTCSISINHSLGDQQWLNGQVQRLWNCPMFFTMQLDHSSQGIIEMFMYTGKGSTLLTLRPSEFAYVAFIAEAAVSLSGHCESTKWIFFWPFCHHEVLSPHCTLCCPSWWWEILFTSLGLVLQPQGPNRSNVLVTSWGVSPSYLSYFGFNFIVEYSRTCCWITEGEVHREKKNLYLSWDSCLIVPNSQVWLSQKLYPGALVHEVTKNVEYRLQM